MIHYIIIKFIDTVSNKEELSNQINELFLRSYGITGIHQVEVFSSCIDKANRYDLMIKMELEPEALEDFDSSVIHQTWKEKFEKYLAAKTIFDCNDNVKLN